MAANADELFEALAGAEAADGAGGEGEEEEYNPDNCGRCGNALGDGPAISAASKNYHPPCFTCKHCGQPFPNGEFFENNNEPYCPTDFHELFGSRCKGCGEVIVGRCITAMDAKWHADHFVCIECGKSLAGGSFIKYEDEAHCKPCAREKKKKKNKPDGIICAKCKEVIPHGDEFIVLQGLRMHPHHFSCHKCKASFKGGTCNEYEGHLYCDPHYRELLSSTCAQCKKPIVGRSVNALGKSWHPEHFVCSHCEVPFSGSSYQVKNGKAYCDTHYTQLFGNVCTWCQKPIQGGSGVRAAGTVYHREHFLCVLCDAPVPGGKFVSWEGKVCCKSCYVRLPRKIRDRETKILKAEQQKKKAEAKAAAAAS